jgi:uncharacterized membrane protein
VLGRRVRGERDPYVAAVLASIVFFFAARAALNAGPYGWSVGALPVVEGAIMALLLRQLLRIELPGTRDLGRLALVAGAALAFVTVAIPLQLHRQWITIGWALEGAALAWLFRRIPHRGLLYTAVALLAAVFARLALNPEILRYEPRGAIRILNWYLYAYLICAVAFLVAAWLFKGSDERISGVDLRPSQILPAGAVILMFLLSSTGIFAPARHYQGSYFDNSEKALMKKDLSESGRNSALAIAAIKGGIKSPEWRSYMMQFVEQNPPGTAVDPKKLDRLLGNDGTNGHPRLDMCRSYLVGNGVCGPDTPDTFDFGVESIDDGIDPGCVQAAASAGSQTKPGRPKPGRKYPTK